VYIEFVKNPVLIKKIVPIQIETKLYFLCNERILKELAKKLYFLCNERILKELAKKTKLES